MRRDRPLAARRNFQQSWTNGGISMRGEVLYYDEAQGFGFLQGADGNRYTFTAENLRRPMEPVKGAAVEFQPKGDKARAISFPRTQGAPRPENRPAGAP